MIDSNCNNNNKTTSTHENSTSINSGTLNFKMNVPFRYKIAITNNQISRLKLISSSKIIFYKKLKNKKKKNLINNWFPNVVEQIKLAIKNSSQQNKHYITSTEEHAIIKHF